MKLILPLTLEAKSSMEALLEEAKNGLEFELGEEEKKKKIAQRMDLLRGEVKKLEAAFVAGDFDALEGLTSKKQQLALIASQNDAHRASPLATQKARANRAGFPWLGLMTRMHAFIRPFLVTCAEERRQEVAALLRPFYQSDDDAYQAARGTPEAMLFQNFLIYRLANIASPKPCVKTMAAVLEKMLAGEDFWTFDSNPKK
jgi:hypothetical protein